MLLGRGRKIKPKMTRQERLTYHLLKAMGKTAEADRCRDQMPSEDEYSDNDEIDLPPVTWPPPQPKRVMSAVEVGMRSRMAAKKKKKEEEKKKRKKKKRGGKKEKKKH